MSSKTQWIDSGIIQKYWGAKYFEDDIIIFQKQEGGEIINKMGKVIDIVMNSAWNGKKNNRYYVIKENGDDGDDYAVHEDLVVDGFYSKRRERFEAAYNSLKKQANLSNNNK